ncbi:MAG: hypothetical protein EXS14_06255 [Planctomycetes bacterium]|nr:hypothetical protein [Planctomycetota bacterium]
MKSASRPKAPERDFLGSALSAEVLSHMRPDSPGIAVVQHMPAKFTTSLACNSCAAGPDQEP